MSPNRKIVCFGEVLIHFAPNNSGKWLDENRLTVYVGGAERNVAKALAQWGNSSSLLTVLPDDFLGAHLHSKLEKEGIEVYAQRESGRMGTYYLSSAEDMQNSNLVYDRFPSVFSKSEFSHVDLEEIFKETGWLHISAITPALSENAFEYSLLLMKEAKKRNVKVSLDLNYRAVLWKEKDPYEKMSQLLPYVDILMGNIWSIEAFLSINIELELSGSPDDENLLKQAELSAKTLQNLYPNVSVVANTFRFTRGAALDYFATLYSDNKLLVSEKYQSDKIEERLGSGDAFMAALIHGYLKGSSEQALLNEAAKVAFQKLFVKGDTINETIMIN